MFSYYITTHFITSNKYYNSYRNLHSAEVMSKSILGLFFRALIYELFLEIFYWKNDKIRIML